VEHVDCTCELRRVVFYLKKRNSCLAVRLCLFAESVSHSVMFFSHNKSANSTFSHGLSAKRIMNKVYGPE